MGYVVVIRSRLAWDEGSAAFVTCAYGSDLSDLAPSCPLVPCRGSVTAAAGVKQDAKTQVGHTPAEIGKEGSIQGRAASAGVEEGPSTEGAVDTRA